MPGDKSMRWLFAFLTLTTLGLPVRACRADAAPFAGDRRFDRHLTLDVREAPLGEFLEQLRKQGHLPVRADAATQDERVTLFCHERPAGEILATVAQHFDYAWARRVKTNEWVLTQTGDQRRREARLRAEQFAAASERLRRRLAERAAEGRWTPEERRRQMIARTQRWLAHAPTPEARSVLEKSLADLEQGVAHHPSPTGEILDGALAAMGPADWNRLRQGERVRFSYPPLPGRVSISQELAATMARPATEWARPTAGADGEQVPAQFAGVDAVRGRAWLILQGGLPALRFECHLIGRQPALRALITQRQEEDGQSSDEPREPGACIDPADAELRREVRLPPPTGQEDPDSLLLSELLALLAPETPYTLIADAYDPDVTASSAPRGPQPLDRWLRAALDGSDEEVRRTGNVLAFRRRAWPTLRPLQVPDRITRPWAAALRREHLLSFQATVEIASRLSDEQSAWIVSHCKARDMVFGGCDLALWQNITPETLAALRLLASLTPAERAVLAAGWACQVALRPDQQALILAWMHPFTPGLTTTVEGSRGPNLPDLEAQLESLDGPADPPEPLFLRLEGKLDPLFAGRYELWPGNDIEKALAEERQMGDPHATRATLPFLPATRWTLTLTGGPEGEARVRTTSVLTVETRGAKRPSKP
jgi:hypothetical protein